MIFDGGLPNQIADPAPDAALQPDLALQPDPAIQPVSADPALPASSDSPDSDAFPDGLLASFSPPPTIDTDALLLAAADRSTQPEAVAATFGIALSRYLDWVSFPIIRRRIETLHEHRDAIKLEAQRAVHEDAVHILAKLMNSADDPVEQRRAATAITRCRLGDRRARSLQFRAGIAPQSRFSPALTSPLSSAPAAIRAADAAAHTPADPIRPSRGTPNRRIRHAHPAEDQPPIILIPPPPRGPDPEPDFPPQLARTLLHRLQDNDNPARGDGLRMLFHFLAPGAKSDIAHHIRSAGLAVDFDSQDLSIAALADAPNIFANLPIRLPLHDLIGHTSAILDLPSFDDITNDQPLTCHQNATIFDASGQAHILFLTFSRPRPDDPRWRITSLHLIPRDELTRHRQMDDPDEVDEPDMFGEPKTLDELGEPDNPKSPEPPGDPGNLAPNSS